MRTRTWWLWRTPFLVRVKGFANGVNPRWGTRTVVVSDTTGNIVRLMNRGKRRVELGGEREGPRRARIFV